MSDAREKIIKAAMELFWLKGFNSTSVADLLSRTQLNSGSLYHVFPSKQDVLVGVLETYRDGIHEMLFAPAWAGVDDPIERIFALLAYYRAGIIGTDCTYGCPIGSLALELHEPDPNVRELIAANFNAWTGAIENLLEEAGQRLPKNLDRAALAQFVLTTMEGGVMQARTHRDVAYFDRAVAQLRTHFDLLEQAARKPAKGRA
ncbi:MAG TPA: TetR/AcrR family transcriptional regulator [Caulobacterales bacterium]|nr:TetR/AcrR family transcriptional regulator [Caulobacterales bacterium]